MRIVMTIWCYVSDHKNNIMVCSSEGDIILDHSTKTHDRWVAWIEFLWEKCQEKAQLDTALTKKIINDLHAELGHPSEVIAHAIAKSIGIQVTGTFKPYEHCTLGKVEKGGVCKKAVAWSKYLGDRLLFDISFPSTPTFGGKKHWLLVEDSIDYAWGHFFKENFVFGKCHNGSN